jgi:L-lactate dehydrogenase complex protein LldG
MSDTKKQLLAKLRKQSIDDVALPEVVDGHWIRFDDPAAEFAESIRFVGGSCETLQSPADLLARLKSFEQFRDAKRIFSRMEEVPGTVDLDATDDPHQLADLDFVVCPGDFAVAENGAIWLTDQNLKHRVVFFITQFLVLVVRQSTIVHTMHEAYVKAKPPKPGFGLFLSGPSKTADIEQSLVIGAHGCRELQVYLIP